MTFNRLSSMQTVADRIAATFVHRLFPSMCTPAYLACPDDECADICRTTIAKAAKKKRVKTEVVDLRPDPAAQLDQVTARLRDINDRTSDDKQPWPTLLILEGFDLLEGDKNDAPTFPFRSRFQFDTEHVWLFMGRDLQRLRRMFSDRRLPLYHAASNITLEWRGAVVNPLKRAISRRCETR
ncbi:MAG TPA: hypothetical protein VJ833_14240 [Rhodanobacteraceae bacterium]|nr:hypothetical protein [Rhodanobacteraceae bacterium]